MRDKAKAKAAAKELVSKMTLEEKASQLRYDAPAIPRLRIPAYNWWNEALHGVARAGVATSFPQAIGMAASFDDDRTNQHSPSSAPCPLPGKGNGICSPYRPLSIVHILILTIRPNNLLSPVK